MGAYYYAGGLKVELEHDDEHVAVDQKLAERAGLDSKLRTASATSARQGGGVLIAQRSALGEDALATLQKVGALQPVYKRDRAVIVAMPEVRIEFDNPDQRHKVMDVLAQGRLPAHTIAEDSDDRIVVRPRSGHGGDALTIANDIYERAHPAAASVRFVQFVPKPALVPNP